MPRSYNQRKAKALSERNRQRALFRWKLERERRDAEEPARIREMAEMEIINLPRKQGDAIGCLQWADFSTGKVRRWTVRIGDRIDRITLESPDGRKTASHGWTWVLDHLRGFLAGRKI